MPHDHVFGFGFWKRILNSKQNAGLCILHSLDYNILVWHSSRVLRKHLKHSFLKLLIKLMDEHLSQNSATNTFILKNSESTTMTHMVP